MYNLKNVFKQPRPFTPLPLIFFTSSCTNLACLLPPFARLHQSPRLALGEKWLTPSKKKTKDTGADNHTRSSPTAGSN